VLKEDCLPLTWGEDSLYDIKDKDLKMGRKEDIWGLHNGRGSHGVSDTALKYGFSESIWAFVTALPTEKTFVRQCLLLLHLQIGFSASNQ